MTSLGPIVAGWVPPTSQFNRLVGSYAELVPLMTDHAAALYAAKAEDVDGAIWDYLHVGPFPDAASYRCWVAEVAGRPDPYFYAIRDLDRGTLGGVASYLRNAPEAGSVEVGNITFAPRLQRTRAATEAMYLMMAWAFGAGYRRYEWKCNALNLGSRRAAQRFGFSFEGVHRQAAVVKGRNRDTAWFSVLDAEWPALRDALETWLKADNFDDAGRQRRSLSTLTRPLIAARDPVVA